MIHKVDIDNGLIEMDFAGQLTTIRFTNKSLKKAFDVEPKKESNSTFDAGYYYIPNLLFGSILAYGGPELESVDQVADVYYELPVSEQEIIELFMGEFQQRQDQSAKAILNPEYRKERLKTILSENPGLISGKKTELQPLK